MWRAVALLLAVSQLALRTLGYVLVTGFGSSDPIRVFTLDSVAGGLSAQGSFAVDAHFGANHSGWLSFTRDLSRVYAAVGGAVAVATATATLGPDGNVSTFSIASFAASTRCDDPVHISLSSDQSVLSSVSYNVGSYTTFFASSLAVAQTRYACSRAHQSVTAPNPRGGDNLLVPCLGDDRIRTDTLGGPGCSPPGAVCNNSAGAAVSRPGGGPRHLALHPTLPVAFVLNELDSTLAVWAYSSSAPQLEDPAYVTTLAPSESSRSNSSFWSAAEVLVSSDGRYVFTSNRAMPNAVAMNLSSSIASFAVRTNGSHTRVEMIGLFGGERGRVVFPRAMCLSPDDKWLVVANQRNNSISVFSVSPDGRLVFASQTFDVGREPIFVAVLPAPVRATSTPSASASSSASASATSSASLSASASMSALASESAGARAASGARAAGGAGDSVWESLAFLALSWTFICVE